MENNVENKVAVEETQQQKKWSKKKTVVAIAVAAVAVAGAVVVCNKNLRGKVSSRFKKMGGRSENTAPQEDQAVPREQQQERVASEGTRYYNNGNKNDFRQRQQPSRFN